MAYHVLAQGFELLDNMSEGEISGNDEFEPVKEEPNRLQEEMCAKNMERQKPEKKFVKDGVPLKGVTGSFMDLKWTDNCLKTKESLLMKRNQKHVSFSSWTTTHGCQITDRFLKSIPLLYLGFAFIVKKAALRYCSTKVSEQMSNISELRKDWKRRTEISEGTRNRREAGTLFAPPTLF